MFIKISKCPHCSRTLDFDLNEPLDDPLGEPGYFFCPFCEKPISKGMIEWEDMTQVQKYSYLFRCAITVLFSSTLVIFLSILLVGSFPKIGKFMGMNDRLDSPVFILYALCVIICISCLVIYTTKTKLNESKRRRNMNAAKMGK